MNPYGTNTRADGKPKRRWSERDDGVLRSNWGDLSLSELARLLDRTELTTYWRGRKLGLPCGCPQGFEYLTDAARRSGYCTTQLRVILHAAGVRLRRAMSVRQHAMRVGLHHTTLATRLRRAGVLGEKHPGGLVRLPADVVDRPGKWLEFDGRSQTVSEWAREVGLPARVIHRRLYAGWSIAEALTAPYLASAGGAS